MQMQPRLRSPLLFLPILAVGLAAIALLADPKAAHSQNKANDHYGLVILNDGYVLSGKVMREGTVNDTDPVTGTPFSYPKGFFLVDDGPRRMYFSQKQVRVVTKMDPPIDDRVDFPIKALTDLRLGAKMPPIEGVLDVGIFNGSLERTFKFRTTVHDKVDMVTFVDLKQRIGTMTPYFVRLDSATKAPWPSVYLTREFTPETLTMALDSHKDFQEQPGMTPAALVARRFRYADFFTRAGYYDAAEKELKHILDTFPDQKERVVERQTAIVRLKAREGFEEIKRLHNGGQNAVVRSRLEKFPIEKVPEDTLAALRELKTEYEGVQERSKQVVGYMSNLLPQIDDPYRSLFTEASKTIAEDMNFDSLPRLETFLSQAKQAERQTKAGKAPDMKPAELMSLAITGWLLGNGAAEANAPMASRLWKTRQFLIDYLRSKDGAAERKKLLNQYMSERSDSLAIDDITRIIPTLPPVEPATETTTNTTETSLGRGASAVTYHVKLPPEYRHSRLYPVLIVLHKEGEKPADMIAKWADQAAENGYILVAPEWERTPGGYTYDDHNEHETVLKTIRDLRQRFQVDSDRIFLFGQGHGANMAHDVGLSHPDLFAAVSSMGVDPQYQAMHYWRSGQYLPFYVVTGTNSGKSEERVHELFEHWIGNQYPMLWVDYKGRGSDWFAGEVPNIFDWMRTKRRAFPIHQVGTDGMGEKFGREYFTVRPTDNSFYWLTTDHIDPTRLIAGMKQWRVFEAARMTAKIDSTKNEIKVSEQGLKQLTIWLGRNAKGENMVDFDKQVSVHINLNAPLMKKVTPSAAFLLEDLFQRGDRQRLFFGKIDIGQ
jgi:acetyl esterase/lipase